MTCSNSGLTAGLHAVEFKLNLDLRSVPVWQPGLPTIGAVLLLTVELARLAHFERGAQHHREADPRSINVLNVTRDNLDLCASWRGYAENRGGGQLGHRQ